MISRYDFMEASNIKDSLSNEVYPDPLSLRIEYDATQIPRIHKLNSIELNRFWIPVAQYYKTTTGDYSDILLTLNEIDYLGKVQAGQEIMVPIKEDIEASPKLAMT